MLLTGRVVACSGTAAILAVGGSKPTVTADENGRIGVQKQMQVFGPPLTSWSWTCLGKPAAVSRWLALGRLVCSGCICMLDNGRNCSPGGARHMAEESHACA
jgi:hypothetical protein